MLDGNGRVVERTVTPRRLFGGGTSPVRRDQILLALLLEWCATSGRVAETRASPSSHEQRASQRAREHQSPRPRRRGVNQGINRERTNGDSDPGDDTAPHEPDERPGVGHAQFLGHGLPGAGGNVIDAPLAMDPADPRRARRDVGVRLPPTVEAGPWRLIRVPDLVVSAASGRADTALRGRATPRSPVVPTPSTTP